MTEGRKVRPEKQRQMTAIKEMLSGAKGAVFVDFRGLKVADDTKLRKVCRESKVTYKVVKNTLALRAARELGLQGLEGIFQGPTAVALSNEDPVTPAKVVHSFMADHPNLKVKGGVLEGSVLSVDRVAYLASLPGKRELVAKVAGGLRSPIVRLVSVCGAPLTALVRCLESLREKRIEQGGMSGVQG